MEDECWKICIGNDIKTHRTQTVARTFQWEMTQFSDIVEKLHNATHAEKKNEHLMKFAVIRKKEGNMRRM